MWGSGWAHSTNLERASPEALRDDHLLALRLLQALLGRDAECVQEEGSRVVVQGDAQRDKRGEKCHTKAHACAGGRALAFVVPGNFTEKSPKPSDDS